MMNEEKKQKNNVELDEQAKNATEAVELMDEDLDKVAGGSYDGPEPPPWCGEVG